MYSAESGAPAKSGGRANSGSKLVIKFEGDTVQYFHASQPFQYRTSHEVVAEINRRMSRLNPAFWVLALGAAAAVFFLRSSGQPLAVLTAAITAAAIVNLISQIRRRTSLQYDLSESREHAFELLHNEFAALSTVDGIWQVDPDAVANGRIKAFLGTPEMPYLKANVSTPGISVCADTYHFLPDQLLIHTRNIYASVTYDEMNVTTKQVDFIETLIVPSDATQVGRSWKYAKRDGSPDLRRKDNRELPVFRYGLVTMKMNQYRLGILVSNLDKAEAFASAVRNMNTPASPAVLQPDLQKMLPVLEPGRWIPCDQTVTLAEFDIPGMVYFGVDLRALNGYAAEPALIDPSKPVALHSESFDPGSIQHCPNYSEIGSGARRSYLAWHASGRSTPDAPIGFVFLFFYGLERRLLHDLSKSGFFDEEYQQILNELRRLIDVYGVNNSFLGYATELLEFAEAIRFRPPLDALPPEFGATTYDFPARLKIALGVMAQKSMPVPAPWARVWATAMPTFPQRTPYRRCRFFFSELFDARYRERFGDGVFLKPNKTLIHLDYRPASPSFDAPISFQSEFSDVTRMKKPIDKLQLLSEECSDQLAAYSRYLGRNPDGEKDLVALALLPPALLSVTQAEHVRTLRDRLVEQEANSALLSRKELLKLAGIPETAAFAKRDATALAQILAAMGFGIEPDVRFGGPAPSSNTKVCLFHLAPAAPTAPTPAYTAAALLIHLAAMVSAADGRVTSQEQEHLESYVANSLDLSQDERHRLEVHLRWVLAERPGLAGIKQRIENLTSTQRQTIGRFLVSIASADGQISVDEVEMLGKTYRILGLNPQAVYSDVHKAATEPITIKAAEAAAHGFALPARQNPPKTPGFHLDAEAIQHKLKETAEVSALLASVFADETISSPPPRIPAFESQNSAFMRVVAAKSTWSRAELESIAFERAILLDGTMEAINETAFDTCDQPAMEGDDPIEVNIAVLTRLIERSVSA